MGDSSEVVSFKMLGPVRLTVGDEEIELGRRQERLLLCLLVWEPGRVVAAERLIDLLWQGDSPVTRRPTLHTYVARLRKSVAPYGIRIRRRYDGYLVDLDAESVDVHQFSARLALARRSSNPFVRLAAVEGGLSLWQGRLMADVAGDSLRERLGAKLEDQRRTALEWRAETLLQLGFARAAVDSLDGLAEDGPVREVLVGILMRGLYALGRAADALHLYDRTRRRLAEELGVDPTADLQAIYLSMLGSPSKH